MNDVPRKFFLVALAELVTAYWPNQKPPSRRWLIALLPTPGNVIFTVILIVGLLWAQSAGAISLGAPMSAAVSTSTIAYQGRLADAAGDPVTGTYPMAFRLYSAAAGGTPLWEEQWTGGNSVQVSDGLFNVMLGSLTSIPHTVVTANNNLFLGISVGSDSEMNPRVQLGTVPFAVQALTVPDGSITAAKLASDISLVPPDGSITPNKISADFFVYKMTVAIPNIPINGTKPNYSFQQNVTFAQPFPHKTLFVIAWLNVSGTHLGVPIAQPWSWDKAGFAINSQFYCNCDITTATLGYTVVGY